MNRLHDESGLVDFTWVINWSDSFINILNTIVHYSWRPAINWFNKVTQ